MIWTLVKRLERVFTVLWMGLLLLSAGGLNAQTFTKILGNAIAEDAGYSLGSAWMDYDGDGDEDLVICNGNGTVTTHVNFLYQNEGDGTFVKVEIGGIVTTSANYQAPAWGDYDNDGDADLFLSTLFEGSSTAQNNFLYRNDGNGNFTAVLDDTVANDAGITVGASWVDFDNDGDLDLFVTNYFGTGRVNYLYRNEGASANYHFTRIDAGAISNDATLSAGANWSDIDNDGDMDLFIPNQNNQNNLLYENEGGGVFTKVLSGSIVNDGGTSETGLWGDYDNDGDLDLFVNNYSQESFLYSNNGDGSFDKVLGNAVTAVLFTGVGSWGDFDNDGDLDLVQTRFSAGNVYFRNDGGGTFTQASGGALTVNNTSGACSVADYDGDGDLDVLITNGGFSNGAETNYLYQNDGNSNNWIRIRCQGTVSNRSAIGARVRVKAVVNGSPRWQVREVAQQTGFAGHNALPAHFGLGDAAMVDSLVIRWPSGIVQVLAAVGVNQQLTVTEAATITSPVVFTKITDPPIPDPNGWGQGGSWADYDGDGDEDLLVINGNNLVGAYHSNFLYENDGLGNFTKITSGEIATDQSFSFGAGWGDYDGDGDLDLFIACGWNTAGQNVPNRLFRNEGGGEFSRILTGDPVTDSHFGRSASWVDYDNDGDLDLFVATTGQTNSKNFFYENDGAGNLTRITEGFLANDGISTQGVAWSDFDQDGDMDVVIGTITGITLYRNDSTNVWHRIPLASGEAFVSLAWGDYDGDGWLDLFAANANFNGGPTDHNRLFHNQQNGTLQQVTSGPVVTDPITQSGVGIWGDFNNDGSLDLYTATSGDHSNLYINDGSGNFVLDTLGVLYHNNTVYASAADFDNDGDIDIINIRAPLANVTFPDYLYRNDTDNGNRWLKVRLTGTVSNTTGIGARIRAKAQIGGQAKWQIREVAHQQGSGNQNSLIAHFGLGDASRVDSLEVYWPASGVRNVYTDVDVNQHFPAVETPDTTGIASWQREHPFAKDFQLAQNYPNPFNPTTVISYQLSVASDVRLTVYNLLGQKVRTLVNGPQAPGQYDVRWDGRDRSGRRVNSGVYVYRLKAGGRSESRKMILLQ